MDDFMGREEGVDRRRQKRVLRAAVLRHAQAQLAVGVRPERVESTMFVDGQRVRFAGAAGNSPLIFTALLNKKGKPSAVSEPEYFVERVTRSLALLVPLRRAPAR